MPARWLAAETVLAMAPSRSFHSASYRAMSCFMSPGAASFGAEPLAASNAALACATSTTCVSRSTTPTNAWPFRSKVPSLNGTGAPPDCAPVDWLHPATATANTSATNTGCSCHSCPP